MNKNTRKAKAMGLTCAPDKWPQKPSDEPMRNGRPVQPVVAGFCVATGFPGNNCKRKSPHRYPTKKDLANISE